MNISRILAVMSKEWREIRRDRLRLALAFLLPVVLMVLLGYGLSFDVEHLPFAVVDHDRTPMSRDYAYRFIGSRYFEFRGYAASAHELDALLADNRIRMGLVIPEHFQQRLRAGRPVAVQTLIDGTFPERALTTKGYVAAINAAVNRGLLADYLGPVLGLSRDRAEALLQPVHLEVRYLYNQAAKSLWSLAPTLLSVVLLITPPFLTSLGVVREKESGAIYNIYSSTVTRWEYLIGKLAPYLAISYANALILGLIAVALFRAPFKGSIALFLVASLLYVMCTTGLGLLISLMVRTQMAAIVATVILTVIPSANYSGMLIPIASLDPLTRAVAHLFPAMYYTETNLGLFLKGVGLDILWPRLAALATYAAVVAALGYLFFRKRVRS